MALSKVTSGLALLGGLLATVQAQDSNESLVLCDCGIGDNKDQPTWSTSRQMNWYKSLSWPNSFSQYPQAPEMAVEVPYENGIYPWNPAGTTAQMPNGDSWSVYIKETTPDGFQAGTAVSDDGETLKCWAYHDRPVSAAVNKTVNHDAICWSAFVCNAQGAPPPKPSDAAPTSSATDAPSPTTSDFSQPPGSGSPTQAPAAGLLNIDATVNPRFINWPSNWDSFINNFVWDQITGNCVGGTFRGNGFMVTFECSGVQIDSDSHMTLQLIKALRDVGLGSLWFNQNPIVPGTNVTNGTVAAQSWVVMPEAFSLTATDATAQKVVGHISYKTTYDNFFSSPCSTCETARFNAAFFDPILEAMKGTYPVYNNYHVQAVCDPWMVCF
jgi:hypothetical protein